MKILFAILALLMALSGPADAVQRHERAGGTLIPPGASGAGYTINTYHVGPFTTANVDTAKTYASGYLWYLWNFFGETTSSSEVTFNSDGSVTLQTAGSSNANAQLASAGYLSTSPHYVGISFGCGGYFTAEVAFSPSNANTSNGWPSWWMMSIEHLASLSGQQWAGQATGYSHFAEVDQLEFDRPNYNQWAYSAAWHDWYGIYDLTCSGGYCNAVQPFPDLPATTPTGTDFTLYHRYAVLWIPATSTTSGSISYYFDDEPVGTPLSWTQFTTQSPPPTNTTPWTMGVMDTQHMTLILGTGSGPMTIRSVDVWQNASACNLTN